LAVFSSLVLVVHMELRVTVAALVDLYVIEIKLVILICYIFPSPTLITGTQ